MTSLIPLLHRAVIAIEGEDRAVFLNGLVSNEIVKLPAHQAVYATLSTPQGKFLHDMLVIEHQGRLLLDVVADRREDLLRRLKMYKLRAKISLIDLSGSWSVFAAAPPLPAEMPSLQAGAAADWQGGVAFGDPRHPELGLRILLPYPPADTSTVGGHAIPPAWTALRLPLGIPEPGADIEIEKSTLLEVGLDGLNAIDWQKGCYVGQEITARTRYRGLLKKKLFSVRIQGPEPQPGTLIFAGEAEVGVLRSVHADYAMALLRLEALTGQAGQTISLQCGQATILAAALPAPADK